MCVFYFNVIEMENRKLIEKNNKLIKENAKLQEFIDSIDLTASSKLSQINNELQGLNNTISELITLSDSVPKSQSNDNS